MYYLLDIKPVIDFLIALAIFVLYFYFCSYFLSIGYKTPDEPSIDYLIAQYLYNYISFSVLFCIYRIYNPRWTPIDFLIVQYLY